MFKIESKKMGYSSDPEKLLVMEDYREYYEEDFTPREAILEEFASA